MTDRDFELLESILGAISFGAIVLDADERVVLWSGWLEGVSGIAATQARGRALAEIFPELAGGRVISAVQGALRQGFPSVLSQSLNKAPFPLFGKVSPKGVKERIQQKINVVPLKRKDGTSYCLVEIYDVSLAVLRERVLGEQKKFLNTILDSEPEGVFVIAAGGEIVQINKAGLAMLEVDSAEEANRRGFSTFILREHRLLFDSLARQVFAGRGGSIEFEVTGAKGSRRWIDTHAAPLCDAQGRVTGLLAVGRDTTERRQAEATTRALIDATQESAMLLDEAGGILAINEIAARRLGYRADELVGGNLFALLPESLAASRRAAAQKVFRTGEPLSIQDERAGIQFDINVYPVFDSNGKVISIAVYAADITERLQQTAVDRLFHEIDQRILHGHSKQELFDFICAEVARIFGFPVAWIGRRVAGGTVALIARGGSVSESYCAELERIGVRWDVVPLGQGLAGTAIRSGQIQAGEVDDPQMAPWREAAARHGLRSCLAIPLILRGEVFGSFALASRTDGNFQSATLVQRLSDIASRICVAQERAMDHEQLRLLQTALSTAANGVFVTDRYGRIEWLNAAFVKMTGYSEQEALGATPRVLRLSNSDESFFQEMLASIAAGEAWSGETVEQRKDGSKFNLRQTITPIRDADGQATHFISILEDVTEMRTAEASVQRLAHYDYLTGLPNRALFSDRLSHELARAKRSRDLLALLFLDLDFFKSVNDNHGHDVGDLLLKEAAVRLKGCVREADTVARLAGDEFTILLQGVLTQENIATVAQKIVTAVAEPFQFGSLTLKISVSIGISMFPEDASDEANLLRCADIAMYAAKRGGRNNFRFYSGHDGQASLDLGSDLAPT